MGEDKQAKRQRRPTAATLYRHITEYMKATSLVKEGAPLLGRLSDRRREDRFFVHRQLRHHVSTAAAFKITH